jgi:hypothetical protein
MGRRADSTTARPLSVPTAASRLATRTPLFSNARQVLTGPGFRYVGTGGVDAKEATFVSEVSMEPASQPAPSTSASAAGAPFSTPR